MLRWMSFVLTVSTGVTTVWWMNGMDGETLDSIRFNSIQLRYVIGLGLSTHTHTCRGARAADQGVERTEDGLDGPRPHAGREVLDCVISNREGGMERKHTP